VPIRELSISSSNDSQTFMQPNRGPGFRTSGTIVEASQAPGAHLLVVFRAEDESLYLLTALGHTGTTPTTAYFSADAKQGDGETLVNTR
jgi:hypothetical protein